MRKLLQAINEAIALLIDLIVLIFNYIYYLTASNVSTTSQTSVYASDPTFMGKYRKYCLSLKLKNDHHHFAT
ncbi:MAG: hypothetical protein V7K47_26570 [Nostoc sp.]